MAASLQSKIDDLEARFKAESLEDNTHSRISEPNIIAKNSALNLNLNTTSSNLKIKTAPNDESIDPSQTFYPKKVASLSCSDNIFTLQRPTLSQRPRSGTPQRVLLSNHFTQAFTSSPTKLSLESPSPSSSSDHSASNSTINHTSNPNPILLKKVPKSIVPFSLTPMKKRPGSAGNIGNFNMVEGLSLGGGSRKRQVFNLNNISAKSQDSLEIEQKYIEIMKSAGYLNINGESIATDIQEMGVLGELGSGTCGHVIKMLHIPSDTVMAVKQMRRSGNSEENKRIIMDLDVVMKCHNCPYIVKSLGTFITSTDVWICMELMATCLDKLMKRLGEPIPEKVLGKVTVATLNALNYLKETHGVIHRDVKPSNILLDERGRIKLCDFGISGRLVDSKAKTRSAGCAAYMAPERIDPPDPTQPDYDIRADVWSLGLTLVELALGEFPYKNCQSDFEVLTKVLHDEQPRLPSNKGFSMDFVNFVDLCLAKDYHRRPKYQKLLRHNFVKRYTGLYVDVSSWYAQLPSNNITNIANNNIVNNNIVNNNIVNNNIVNNNSHSNSDSKINVKKFNNSNNNINNINSFNNNNNNNNNNFNVTYNIGNHINKTTDLVNNNTEFSNKLNNISDDNFNDFDRFTTNFPNVSNNFNDTFQHSFLTFNNSDVKKSSLESSPSFKPYTNNHPNNNHNNNNSNNPNNKITNNNANNKNNPFFVPKSKKPTLHYSAAHSQPSSFHQQPPSNPPSSFSYPSVKRFDPLCTDPPTPLSPSSSSSPHAWSSFSSSSLKSSTFSPSPSSSYPFNSSLSSSSSNTASPYKSPPSSSHPPYSSTYHITPSFNTPSFFQHPQNLNTTNLSFNNSNNINTSFFNQQVTPSPYSSPPIQSSPWSPDNPSFSSAQRSPYVSPASPAISKNNSSISLSANSSSHLASPAHHSTISTSPLHHQQSPSPHHKFSSSKLHNTHSSPSSLSNPNHASFHPSQLPHTPIKATSIKLTLSNPFFNSPSLSSSTSSSSSQPHFTTSYKTRLQNTTRTCNPRHFL